jgi:hypothetical protein
VKKRTGVQVYCNSRKFFIFLLEGFKKEIYLQSFYAGIAQLVEHDLAKVGVAGSSLVSRSFFLMGLPL